MTYVGPVGRDSEAVALVKSLLGRGFSLEVVGARLHVRPAGRLTEEERAAVRRLKCEIVDTLPRNGTNGINGTTAPGEAVSAGDTPRPPVGASAVPVARPAAWSQGAADAELAKVNARLDRALAPGAEADTPARRTVAEDYRRVAVRLHGRRDPVFWEVMGSVQARLAEWRGDSDPVPVMWCEQGD